MRRLFIFLVLLAIILYPEGGVSAAASQRQFRVGVLVSLTGSWSTLGHNTVAALQLAADQIDADARRQHGGYRLRLLVRDTGLDPVRALEAVKDLHRRGVVAVIGPQSSAELAMIKPYADQHDIIIVSQSSTASSLAIANDSIFRFCPSDIREASAITSLMWRDGVRTIVPLWRNDDGNNGLHESVQQAFLALGGQVTPGFRYEPTTTDFTAAIERVADEVTSANVGAASPAAVYLAAFDEVTDVFGTAQGDATLGATRWYGSDGVALSQALLDDPTAAQFASRAGFPNPIFGLDDAAQASWQPVSDGVAARTGIRPDAFALSAYDALFVVRRALEAVGEVIDPLALRAAFVDAAEAHVGITGSTALDEAGDRVVERFNFWAVRMTEAVPSWVRVGRYSSGTLYWY
jgi:branched-chain amino acid transport system substrate-binding protein